MNKKFIATLALAMILPIMAYAGSNKKGGFIADNSPQQIVTISAIEDMDDDTYVILQGTITSKVGDETYMFQDNTGTIQVEIDDDNWNGLTVKPGDVVVIEGEIDKSWTGPTEIEVDVIRMAN